MRESLNLPSNRIYMFKVNLFVHSAGMDGGSIKEADGCSQWFLSLRSVASGLEKPLLASYRFVSWSLNSDIFLSQDYDCAYIRKCE